MPPSPQVLVLTPVKDAVRYIPRFFELLCRLELPESSLSLGMLEGDSTDATFSVCEDYLRRHSDRFRRTSLIQKNFGLRIPPGFHKHDPSLQVMRRSILAKVRNHLLFHALRDEDQWVLWIDVDLIDYQPDIVTKLIGYGREIIQPDCRLSGSSTSYDLNAWRAHGGIHLHDLTNAADVEELHSVGGAMLLVRADVHRDGLVFPSYPYGLGNARIRPVGSNHWHGEIETEGLGIMASDMGVKCWGLPKLITIHSP